VNVKCSYVFANFLVLDAKDDGEMSLILGDHS
jgi:hypothetical protein